MKKSLAILPLLALSLFGCNTKSAEDIVGDWNIKSFEKDGVQQQIAVSDISFEKKSGSSFDVKGNSGVNSFFGTVSVKNGTFKASENMGSTKMAGSPEAMAFEDDFLACLTGADAVEITEVDGKKVLKITDKDTKSVLSFTRK